MLNTHNITLNKLLYNKLPFEDFLSIDDGSEGIDWFILSGA